MAFGFFESQTARELRARVQTLEKQMAAIMHALDLEPDPLAEELEIQMLLDTREKIKAVKRIRELTGCGLRDAMDAIEADTWRSMLRWNVESE